uniref:Transposase MuDR plant domain-containing protein n=1 Tax=Lactuca sativa TaxID=4236 RepID=A0A9R1UHM4_LACSA|nr:hypothetical protein LSAT_V11C900484710 [Lactuca sativa]
MIKDNADNIEVTEEFNEMNKFIEINEINEENVDDYVHEGEDNVEMRCYTIDDGIEDEDKTETDKENDERSDESEDSELWVDEDNIIPDVELDIKDFYMNIDLEAEFLEKRVTKHSDNESEDDPEELDVIDNEQWDSLDEGSDIERKMRVVLKELGKETRCSQGEIHKVTFRIRQKYKSKELKEKIQLHALEMRSNIFFKKNNKMRLRDLCKGTIAFTDGEVGERTPCPWVIHGSRSIVDSTWFIKTYNQENRCLQKRKIESNPTIPVKLFKNNCKRSTKLDSLFTRDSRPNLLQINMCKGITKSSMLFLSTNPDTTIKLQFDYEPKPSATSRRFKRVREFILSHLYDNIVVFSSRAISYMLLNNFCEVFNSKLIEGRDKPLISYLEYIREYMMKIICNVIKVQNNTQLGEMGQTITKCKGHSRINMLLTWLKEYEVRVTGLPCKHVIVVQNDKADNGEKVRKLHTYAHRVYWLETWKGTYVYKVELIKGRAIKCPNKITPPLHHNQLGRPKKKGSNMLRRKDRRKETMVLVGVESLQ